jgi:toxin YoeB
MYRLLFMTQAQKDAKKLNASGLKHKALELLKIIHRDPLQYPSDFEYLKGDMRGLSTVESTDNIGSSMRSSKTKSA